MKKKTSHSEAQTFTVANELALRLKPPYVIALSGDLGAGKTTFAKGLIHAWTDPAMRLQATFLTLQTYDAAVPVYHFDLYHMKDLWLFKKRV